MSRKVEDYHKRMEERMARDLERIERELAEHPEITMQVADESIKQRIDAKIAGEAEDYDTLLSQLPEEVQEDIRLGRKYREEQNTKAKHRAYAYWKRVAAVVVVVALAAGMGVTSVGGPKRVKEFFATIVGSREVDRIASTAEEDVLEAISEKEEEAYQQIKDELGIDPVKLIMCLENMKFKSVEIDPYLQTAYLIYDYGGKNISYIIQCFYTDGAWGTDLEDDLLDEYPFELKKAMATVKEYQFDESTEKMYEARFEYQDAEYQLIAVMEKDEFENLLNYLHFL